MYIYLLGGMDNLTFPEATKQMYAQTCNIHTGRSQEQIWASIIPKSADLFFSLFLGQTSRENLSSLVTRLNKPRLPSRQKPGYLTSSYLPRPAEPLDMEGTPLTARTRFR